MLSDTMIDYQVVQYTQLNASLQDECDDLKEKNLTLSRKVESLVCQVSEIQYKRECEQNEMQALLEKQTALVSRQADSIRQQQVENEQLSSEVERLTLLLKTYDNDSGNQALEMAELERKHEAIVDGLQREHTVLEGVNAEQAVRIETLKSELNTAKSHIDQLERETLGHVDSDALRDEILRLKSHIDALTAEISANDSQINKLESEHAAEVDSIHAKHAQEVRELAIDLEKQNAKSVAELLEVKSHLRQVEDDMSNLQTQYDGVCKQNAKLMNDCIMTLNETRDKDRQMEAMNNLIAALASEKDATDEEKDKFKNEAMRTEVCIMSVLNVIVRSNCRLRQPDLRRY